METKAFKQKILTAVTVPNVLTRSQCEMIIHDAKMIGMSRAPVLSKDGSRVVSRTRTCDSCWLPKGMQDMAFSWVYSYVSAVVNEVNHEHYKFHISDMQNLQVLRYRPGQRFKWHFDTFDGSDRKLTMVINLSRPQEYVLGGLQIDGDWHNVEHGKEQGAATIFPSWMKHRAKAPVLGTRWSLVAWITGARWR